MFNDKNEIMEMYNNVFNAVNIYNTLFFNVKTVLKYPTLDDLKKDNLGLYEILMENIGFKESNNKNEFYKNYCINIPQLVKVVAITYATINSENGEMKRHLEKIANDDESLNIISFIDILHGLNVDDKKENKIIFLCGHDIINNDIPILMDKFIQYKNDFPTKTLPQILKNYLISKPWETNVIDTSLLFGFNGSTKPIKDYHFTMTTMRLNDKARLLNPVELSDYFWNNQNATLKETLIDIVKQSALTTSLAISIFKELRSL